jgi:hypothetical protein
VNLAKFRIRRHACRKPNERGESIIALFGKKKSRDQSIDANEPDWPNIEDDDLFLARQGMSHFEQACADGRDIKAAVLEIATAGGGLDLEQLVKIQMGGGDPPYDRPWWWLASVARAASNKMDLDLVAHIAFFAFYWAITPALQQIHPNDAI